MGRYRSRLEIVRDILLAVSMNKGCRKTRIMYGASLSYKLLTRYLRELLKAGAVEYDGESRYWVTDKGEVFLGLFEEYARSRGVLERQIGDLEKEKKALKRMITI